MYLYPFWLGSFETKCNECIQCIMSRAYVLFQKLHAIGNAKINQPFNLQSLF